ncbi:hypothetical protein PL11_004655 [Lentilactobacillus curieae]|uniref:Uncharacterized protein n=1 Tax=Lentilactobacillus curieae TaxID=1138822 RepID=A0A1S6QL43_9LACO|nr:hypothetical protein PL11_004655 [Lentilactobacillus curieae]
MWHNGVEGGGTVAKKVKFDELSDDAKEQAAFDFIRFYLGRYKVNNLEILSSYKVDYFLNDINHFIFENQSLTPKQIQTELFRRCGNEINSVISTIDPEYYDSGNLVADTWDNWYEQKFEKIPVHD